MREIGGDIFVTRLSALFVGVIWGGETLDISWPILLSDHFRIGRWEKDTPML